MSVLDDLKAASLRGMVAHQLEGTGATVWLAPLSAAWGDRFDQLKELTGLNEQLDGLGELDEEQHQAVVSEWSQQQQVMISLISVADAVRDENGDRVFSFDDLDAVRDLSMSVIGELVDAIPKLESEEASEDAKKPDTFAALAS